MLLLDIPFSFCGVLTSCIVSFTSNHLQVHDLENVNKDGVRVAAVTFGGSADIDFDFDDLGFDTTAIQNTLFDLPQGTSTFVRV